MRSQRRPRRALVPTTDMLDRRELLSASPAASSLRSLSTEPVVRPQNDTRSAADNLGTIRGTKSVNGSVGGSDPRDYYKFVAQRGKLEVRLTNLSDDIDFELLNSS